MRIQLNTLPAKWANLQFSGKQSGSITVWQPPHYVPGDMAHNLKEPEKTRTIELYRRYNDQVKIMKAVALSLARDLEHHNAPEAVLCPCPNPMSQNTITIMLPLKDKGNQNDQKLSAAKDKQNMVDILKRITGQNPPNGNSTFMYSFQQHTYEVVVIIEPTDEEVWASELFS